MIELKADYGSRKIMIKIGNVSNDIRKGIRQAFYFSGKKIITDLRKDFLRKPRYGRTYIIKRKGRRIRHTASVPGETPANLSGKLRKSSNFLVKGHEQLDLFYHDVDYGEYLEFGTKKMKPRPGLKIWISKNERDIESFFERELKKALN